MFDTRSSGQVRGAEKFYFALRLKRGFYAPGVSGIIKNKKTALIQG